RARRSPSGGAPPNLRGPAEPGAPAEEAAVVWSPEVEVCLFHAMLGHKPVGVNRHFHMICIRDKFSQNIGRQISSKVIWDHLSTMYDMQALHESEILPFPNIEKNFALPDEMIQEVREGEIKLSLIFLNLNALCWELCSHGGNRAYKSKEIVKLCAEMGRWAECLFYFILIILLLLNKRLVFLTLCCRTSQM
uniref:MRG domain binding protein n=1 Tax=Taeniopygia guttata TaxID=59729 RepID=H0ZBF3_TAEGU